MKRRIGILLLVAALMLSLCACAPESKVIRAIDAIGEVTVKSGAAIEKAESLYDELDADAQAKVTNWDVLMDARSEYDRQTKLIEDAEDLVDAIGDVTLEKGEAITAARAAYDKAKEYDIEDSLKQKVKILEDAENEYETVLNEASKVLEGLRADMKAGNYDAIVAEAAPYVENLPEGQWKTDFADVAAEAIITQATECYVAGDLENAKATVSAGADFAPYCSADRGAELNKLMGDINDVCTMATQLESLVNTGKYNQVESLVAPYLDKYPAGAGRAELADTMVNCMLEEATAQYKGGNSKNAMDIMNRAVKYKGICSTNMMNTAETQRNTLISELSRKAPKNGAIIERTYRPGRNTFKITAGSYDTVVKMQLIDDSSKYVIVYVRANKTTKVNLQNGTYKITYTCGPVWYGKETMFGSDATFVQLNGTMTMQGYTSGRYVYYYAYTCTLKTGYGSDWGFQNISPSKF